MAEETIVVHSAGQHTLSGDAFLVDGALGVASADGNATSFVASVAATAFAIATASHWNADAFRFGRSGESGRARANGRVIYWPALGVHAASAVQQTRIDALSTDTGLAVLTFDVGLAGWFANSAVTERVGRAVRLSLTADRLTDAADISVGSVAFKSLAANASGFVIGWQTVGVGSARVSGTDVLTFRLALFSAANGRGRTIRVLSAFNRLLASFLVRFTDGSGWAKTLVRAAGVLATGSGRAGRLGTIVDGCATGLDVARVAWLAFADGLVFLREAERVLTAEILDHAGDFAAIVVTAFVGRTFLVVGTFNLETADLIVLRVAEKAFLATADGLAVDHLTGGVAAAEDRAIAWVSTFSFAVGGFQAIFTVPAFLVAAATDLLDADAVVANLAAGALGIFSTSWTAFAFDAVLRW